MDKAYTAGEAKAWLNGYDEGKKIRMSERSIQTSDNKEVESARAWVDLTDDEMLMIYAQPHEGFKYSLGRMVQALLKEKNT